MDPKINRSYAELAAHYGCLVDPARVVRPRDEARVERPMPYVRDSFWRAGSSPACSRCRPRRSAGRWRSQAGERAGRWKAPFPPSCSRRWRRMRCARCLQDRSCWPRGPPRRSGPTSRRTESRQALGDHRLRGWIRQRAAPGCGTCLLGREIVLCIRAGPGGVRGCRSNLAAPARGAEVTWNPVTYG